MNPDFWHAKRVFLTGHTGFKGSWLSLWIQRLGAELTGFSLPPPTHPSLFEEANIEKGMVSIIDDICDLKALQQAMKSARPEIVIHLAAQALVRYSYKNPLETYFTNVMGTVHLLEAIRQIGCVKVIINVTTDKCYENKEWVWGYREDDAMGGFDPYSSSKGCSELITSAYRRSFFEQSSIGIASARAGNVIGGGDWAEDRLVPDVLRAFERKEPINMRNPNSTRPWQHVLEPLSGYLTLAEKLWSDPEAYSDAWNFGPKDEDAKPVDWIVKRLADKWGEGAAWHVDDGNHPHEAGYLKLDISKARHKLGWTPHWSLDVALDRVVEWHQAYLARQDMRAKTVSQIEEFCD